MKSFEGLDNSFQEGEKKSSDLVEKLAGMAHDEWRASRKIKGMDTYEPRLKETKDKEWIRVHNGTTKVDIANTPYTELPSDWQAENEASAEIAVNEVLDAAMQSLPFDNVFIERVANLLHQGWVERNKDWAPEELKKPYVELSEEEKEKDRHFVRKAIKIFNKHQ